jgi:hypothetical protein
VQPARRKEAEDVKNSIGVVQLYGCGAQGNLYLYSEDTTITACIRLGRLLSELRVVTMSI